MNSLETTLLPDSIMTSHIMRMYLPVSNPLYVVSIIYGTAIQRDFIGLQVDKIGRVN